MKVGDTASITKKITAADVESFAELSLDTNPLHLDEQFAAQSRFGRKISHGALVSGLISAVLGTKLPGPGTIYLSQSLNYHAPVYHEDEVTAKVTIEEIKDKRDKQIFRCSTICTNQTNDVVMDGEAFVMLMKEQ
ncbi:MaoC family dehydratase [Tumebacillus permanentifrigoris]|uniref:3-hydroxybutyryl-CoA dehydratase n=1 Tax=Tumebacillus permanentifrigoris TaxID=378543 RepID=A0A316DDR9_9BACL|nr:MaoC family dehydratase [Tumebacillus permanentifrigoris]PWK16174.1 3-hydroxybutyryl-CoA dehydratase [Tumebacillus permanentifrigoris]